MTAQHVPAWKRLGLTLKHAKDIPLPPSPVAANEGHKAKRRHDETDESQTPKKRKVDDSHELMENSTPTGKTSLRASPEKSIPSSIKKSPTKISHRRKSVSFSTDTKTEDGDTAQNAFRAWVAEQNYIEAEEDEARRRAERANSALAATPADSSSAPPSTASSTPASAPTTAPATTPEKSTKRKSKPKDPKLDTTSASVPSAQKKVKVRAPKTSDKPVPEYIHYLENYYNDRSSWKFNKSKQNDLLKNVWNVYRVPPHLNDALVEYISGLQGAGARQRLKDAARTIGTETVAFIRREIPEIKTDPMDTAEARRAALEAAEQREMERLKSLGLDLGKNDERVKTLKEKRDEDERAARLLSALIGDALGEMNGIDISSSQEPTKQETARARKKKKRSRTVASDSDSSSDSDSDSDSDADGRPSSKKKQKTETKAKASTASASDSDSTSDSDSDSDSDSSSDSDSGSSGSGSSSDSDSSEIEEDSSDDDSGSETG